MGKIVTRAIKRVSESDPEPEIFQPPVIEEKKEELTPVQPLAAPEHPSNFRAYLSDGELEQYEERAAIREYDGGLTREEAEAGALEDLWYIRNESYDEFTKNIIQEYDAIEVGNIERFKYAVA